MPSDCLEPAICNGQNTDDTDDFITEMFGGSLVSTATAGTGIRDTSNAYVRCVESLGGTKSIPS